MTNCKYRFKQVIKTGVGDDEDVEYNFQLMEINKDESNETFIKIVVLNLNVQESLKKKVMRLQPCVSGGTYYFP